MRQFTLTAAIALCLSNFACSQNKTYIGFEFSIANDLYKIDDNGDYLIAVPLVDGQGGINIRQELNRKFFIETGLIMKYYWEGYGFKTIPYYGSGSSEASWLIPLRFGFNFNLYKEKIFLVPVVGYTVGINPPVDASYGYGTQTSSTTTINYIESSSSDVSRYFSLLQTGMGLEFKVSKALLISLSGNYYSGFNETTHLDIAYTVNNSAPITGTAISKGQFWSISTGIKYPISNLWTKDKAL